MPQRVKAPDGSLLEFPDDMSESQILAVMRREYPPAKTAPRPATVAAKPAPVAAPVKPTPAVRRPAAPQSSALGAATRAAAAEAAPTIFGSLPGMAAGAQLGAGAGTLLGFGTPLEVVTIPAGTIIGGLGGAMLGREAIVRGGEAVMSRLPKDAQASIRDLKARVGLGDEQLRADVAQHPTAVAVGSAVPGFAVGRPSKKAAELVLGTTFGAGTEAIRQAYAGEKPDVGRIAAMGGVGALQSGQTGLSRRLTGTPETAFERGARETVQPGGRRAQRGRAEASAALRRTQAGIQQAGVAPRPVDVMAAETTRAVVTPAAAASDEAARLLHKYREDVSGAGPEGTQVAGQRAAAAVAPEAPGVTAREMGSAAEQEIAAAGESVAPGVQLGEASSSTARRLAAQAQQDREALRAAYEDTGQAGVSAVAFPRPGKEVWQPITPKQAQQYAKGLVNDPENPLMINTQTTEVLPRSEIGPQNVAEFNAALRDPISGFMEDPDSIKPVLKVLGDLEKTSVSTLDTTNLFGARKRLAAIERDFGGSASGAAAGRVRRKLDEIMGVWSDKGLFTGPTEVVDKMRATTAQARKYYQDWESGDIAQRLTETRFGPNGRETVIDPDAARRTIFGALQDTNTALKNMKTLRDRLGADSPEWNALRQEAIEQLIGSRTEGGKFTQQLAKFERENPAMADILLSPSDRARFEAASARVQGATDIKAALQTGDAALTMEPPDFASAVAGLKGAPLRAAKVALRSRLQQQLGTPEGALALLDSQLSRGTTARANIERLLGAQEAERLFHQAEALSQRARRAQSASQAAETAIRTGSIAEGIRAGERGAGGMSFLAPLTRFLEARGMDRGEALRTVQEALDPSKTEATIAHLEKLYGENAAQAFWRRIRANTSRAPGLGGLPRRAVERAAVAAVPAKPGEKPKPAEEVAPPRIDEPLPPREQTDKELSDFFGVSDTDGLPPPPAPPTAEDERAQATGVPMSKIRAAYLGAEGAARNPMSSATGTGQFIDSTFAGLMREAYPEQTKGLSDKAIAARFRGAKLEDGSAVEDHLLDRMEAKTVNMLQSINAPVTPTNVYLSHFLGQGGAKAALQADPNASIEAVLNSVQKGAGTEAVRRNRRVLTDDKGRPVSVGVAIDRLSEIMARRLAQVGES